MLWLMKLSLFSGPCPDGFIDDGSHQVCYRFLDNNITAQEAQVTCATQIPSSNLPIFRTAPEINAYMTLA